MHPHMIFDIDECEELSSLRNKTTILMATSQAPINFLMWSVFSFLLRSRPNGFLEHMNIAINGPDKRTGETALQDEKQAFLEDLRNLKWENSLGSQVKDMPLTVLRVWSRVGADQSLEMAKHWVHTDSYIYTHDDVCLLKNGWEDEVISALYDPKVAMVFSPPLLQGTIYVNEVDKIRTLNFPYLSAHFIAMRKGPIAKTGVRWAGYQIDKEFVIDNIDDFLEHNAGHIFSKCNLESKFNHLSHEFGSWVYYKLTKLNYEIKQLQNLVYHFGAMSTNGQANQGRIKVGAKHIQELEKTIYENKTYSKLYSKYRKDLP